MNKRKRILLTAAHSDKTEYPVARQCCDANAADKLSSSFCHVCT
jgi:hypothetical protein